MRLVGTVNVYVAGSLVEREPTRWEKLKRSLGASLDLGTDLVKVELEATALVDGVRRALGRLGVTNALALVIDDTVIFQDTQGKSDDIGDLVLALADHASVFGRGFKELRFAAEHSEGGLHLIIETRARTVHRADEAAAVVSIGGRLQALEPLAGESAEQYRARVEPLIKDTVAFEAARLQFQSFVTRLEEALAATLPSARVEEMRAEARLVKPPVRQPQRVQPAPVRDPAHPAYDPFLVYYPSPLGTMLDVMMISSFMNAMHPPHVFVTDFGGSSFGSVADVQAEPALLSEDFADRGGEHAGAEGGLDDAAFDDGGQVDEAGGSGVDDDGGGGFDDSGGGFDDGGGGFDD
jgi:hypothetical protein